MMMMIAADDDDDDDGVSSKRSFGIDPIRYGYPFSFEWNKIESSKINKEGDIFACE